MDGIKKINQHIGFKDASFYIRILFRKSANWQGEIHWLDADKKKRFRSTLELVMLMQEALEEAGVPEADYTIRSWEDVKRQNKISCELYDE